MIELEAARARAAAQARAGDGPRATRVRAWLEAASATDADALVAAEPAAPAAVAARAPDCERCVDHCCRAPHRVSLRLLDVAVLLDAGLGEAVAPPPGRATLPLASPESATRLPRLRQTTEGDCVFLDRAGRCAIYPIRPLTCRRFPYFVGDDARVAWASSCRSARPAAPDELAAHLRAARESWATKARELDALAAGTAALEALGLDAALWAQPPAGPSFAEVLARRRAKLGR